MGDENTNIKLPNSLLYKVTLLVILIIPVVLYPVYPAMIQRMIIIILLMIAGFFGFATDEMHCKYVYNQIKIKIFRWSWSLGCQPRIVAILISISTYTLAALFSYLLEI